MIVIQHGDEDTRLMLHIRKFEPVRFTCNKCGCVFVCGSDEYGSCYTPWPENAEVYLSNCPDCNNRVRASWRDKLSVKDLKEILKNETSNV